MGIKNWFKKKDDGILDLSYLQKRGLLKDKPVQDTVVDLSSNEDSSPLGFIGALANASSNSEEASSVVLSNSGKQKLKGILRDVQSRVDSASNKIYKLTDRIDLLEKKIERLERRAGVDSV